MFPDLSGVDVLALDIETYDPNLKKLGPGVRRGDGHILGLALATEDREWYFPWTDATSRFLFDLPVRDFITQNGLYDYDWLGFVPQGRMWDTKIAEALLDSNKFKFNLDSLAKKYLKESKGDDEITSYAQSKGWLSRGHDAQEFLKDMPVELVGRYAMKDVRQTFDIFSKQRPLLEDQNLEVVFDLETRLLKPVLQMIRNGVRIDEEALHRTSVHYQMQQEALEHSIRGIVGPRMNINSGKQLAEFYDRKGWSYRLTDKGNPSFGKAELETHDNELAPILMQYRKIEKLRNSFIDALPKFIVNGRIHAGINTVKGDSGGTETGRFSYYNPNFQQIPSRDPEAKKLLRGVFLPEEGELWYKPDYSSEEPRITAHYAIGPGSDEIRSLYNRDPRFDIYTHFARVTNYHGFAGATPEEQKKIRSLFKTIVLGVNYGMGKDKLIKSLGLTSAEGDRFLSLFHRSFPFLKQTMQLATKVGERRGWVKTLLGRRRRFDKRDFAYKGLNSVVQGSAGDIMKKAMVDAYEAGIFKEITPLITVHDELDVSAHPDKEPVVRELVHIMETCVELKVPLVVDIEKGPNWGEVK